MRKIKNPKMEALAFRIWAFAQSREWDVSVKDVAAHVDERWQRVRSICQSRGWLIRMRKDAQSRFNGFGVGVNFHGGGWHTTRDDIDGHLGAIDDELLFGVETQ